MEVIHSVIAPALYSLLVSLPPSPLLVQSLPSTPHPHPSVAPPPPALSLQVYRQFLLLLLLSFSPSPSPSLPPAPAPPLIAFREKLPLTNSRAPPPPLDTLPLVTLHSNTRTPHVLCKPRSFSIACSPIPTGASNRTV
ncbi:Hypothetical protein J6889_03679 [Nakaseomyces glabratus]